MKTCNTCKLNKPCTDFYKNKTTKDGYTAQCKCCRKSYQRQRAENMIIKPVKEKLCPRCGVTKASNQFRKTCWNKDRLVSECKRCTNKRSSRDWKLRRGNKPKWLTIQQNREIDLYYKLARTLIRVYGIPHQVDHIEPLNGKNSCGLHVPWNLQVLTATENLKKSNNREIG